MYLIQQDNISWQTVDLFGIELLLYLFYSSNLFVYRLSVVPCLSFIEMHQMYTNRNQFPTIPVSIVSDPLRQYCLNSNGAYFTDNVTHEPS